MAETETEQPQARCFALRVPVDLYREIERDANELGVSMSDAGRMRLRTGRCPSMKDNAHGE